MTPSIVLLGNLLVDDVVLADGTTRMGQAGGAVLYSALGATLWGARPGLVSVVGNDYPAKVLEELRQRGADLTGVDPLDGPGVRTWLLYEGRDRRLIHRLGCPTHEQVSPRPGMIPAEWSDAPAFHLAPMPFEVQRTLVATRCGSRSRGRVSWRRSRCSRTRTRPPPARWRCAAATARGARSGSWTAATPRSPRTGPTSTPSGSSGRPARSRRPCTTSWP